MISISTDGYTPDLTKFPRKTIPSSRYKPTGTADATPHLLSMRNQPEGKKSMLELVQASESQNAIILSDTYIEGRFKSHGRHLHTRCAYIAYDVGLFIQDYSRCLIGKRQDDGHWLIYPVNFSLSAKFDCLMTGQKLHIGSRVNANGAYGGLCLKDKDGTEILPFSKLDIQSHAFAEHLAEEMRDLSYLMDGVDMSQGNPALVSLWRYDEIATPEMEADLNFLARYLNKIFPEAPTLLELLPPQALQNGKSIWPSLRVRFGHKYNAKVPISWREAASDWATQRLHQGHLAMNGKEMSVFRRMHEEDQDAGPGNVAKTFWAHSQLSNHQALSAQSRFGPLPKMP